MVERSEPNIDEERVSSVQTGSHGGPSDGEPTARSAASRRLVTDGGEEDEADSAQADDEPADASGEETAEEADDGDAEADPADEADAEREGGQEEQAQAEEAEAEEAEETDTEEEAEAEEGEEAQEEAGLVYLDLEGLFLDVLGLEVDLNEVVLDVSAQPGSNRLLGNLLSSVSGLLDGGPGSLLSGLGGGLSSGLNRVLGSVKTTLTTIVPFVGGGEESESESEDEGEGDGGRSFVPSIGSWLRSGLSRLIAALPLEKVIAQIVRTTLEVLLERTEAEPGDVPGVDEEATAQPEEPGAQAEAQS